MTDGFANPAAPRTPDQQDQFLIVGLGASAGGIDALKTFFSRIEKDAVAAYVVILHLSPDHESHLAQLLQNVSAIPVVQVHERVRVEPDHAYVIPPNQTLSMEDGHLALSPVTSLEQRRAPVDIFFRTLAETQGPRAVCVVLSGSGADGSTGLKRVKEHGGLCIVQKPEEAQHADMPRHAIETQLVDHVLAASEIPDRIRAYRHHRDLSQGAADTVEVDEQALREILAQLRARTGHDFAAYKRSTVLRRIERRMAVHELASLGAYAEWLRDHPEDARGLLKDLLISVTNFFRDPDAFAALERTVIRKIFEGKDVNDHVRVWVAGCATGEEVYSVAMLLCERAPDPLRAPTIQVFATDIDEWALAKARAGLYTESDVASVSPERLRRFFTREENGYRVRAELREMILFAAHNVIRHPPYSHLDLITCRNLLIYINRPAQERVLEVFHFGLKADAFLFLGTSESLDGSSELFAPVDHEARIFKSRAVEHRAALSFANLNVTPPPGVPAAPDDTLVEHLTHERLSRQALHQRLLEHYAPPSLLVNKEHEVLHVSEKAGRYLSIGGGEPTRDLLTLVKPELRIDLRMAFYEVLQQRMAVRTRALPVRIEGQDEQVVITVRPMSPEPDALALVFFESVEPGAGGAAGQAGASDADLGARLLEDELIRAKAQLAATIAQHEMQQEELKASNEELQSINEELRSATEELETGKEELQSYNEELSTVNQELKVKVEELTQAHNDTRNLMNSTDTATLFLDKALRIKRFTPRARDLFHLIPGDVGRPLLDIRHRLDYAELAADIRHVAETLQTLTREVRSEDRSWFISKLLPYRTEDDRIDGTVITFTDITARKRAEDGLRATEDQFRRAIDDAPIPMVMQAEDGEVLQLSRSWSELTGYTLSDVPTLDAWLSRAYGEGADAVRDHMRELFAGQRESMGVEFAIRTRRGEERRWSFSASRPGVLADGRRFIVGMAVDVTESARAVQALSRSEQRLRRIVESATDYAIFSTDLEGTIDSWNVGAERIFGFTTQEALGQNGAIIFTPEDRERGAPEQEMRTALHKGSASDERWHLRKNGERFFASGVMFRIDANGVPVGYTKVAQDLTEKRQADEAVRQAREELEARVEDRTRDLAMTNEAMRREMHERKQAEELRVRLLSQLVDAQENERRRLSRELHDQLGQQLTALGLRVRALKEMNAGNEAMLKEIDGVEAIAKNLDADVDFLAWELRPTALDDLGLVDALSDYVATWSKHCGVTANLDTARFGTRRLPGEIETVLYRVTQEALNNVAKHAAARTVDLLLEQHPDHVSLIIEDNGQGFDVEAAVRAAAGLGLVSMRERAAFAGGTLTVESQQGEGTTVYVRIPHPAA